MIWWGHKSRTSRPALMVKAALRMLEDSMCRCGHSMLLTQADDAALAYRAETVTCPACAEAEKSRPKEHEAGQHTYVRDVRDTPGAMDPDAADDIMWFPDDESALTMMAPVGQDVALDGVRYAETAPAAAISSPTPTTTAATIPLLDRASEHAEA